MISALGLPRLMLCKVLVVLAHILNFSKRCLLGAICALGSYSGLMAVQLVLACSWFVFVIENMGSLTVS